MLVIICWLVMQFLDLTLPSSFICTESKEGEPGFWDGGLLGDVSGNSVV